jgi:hypothetical protein
MAESVYPHVTAPTIILNSLYDVCQIYNIFTIDVPSSQWRNNCTTYAHGISPSHCSPQQIDTLNMYRDMLIFAITASDTSSQHSSQNALFLTSCAGHCEMGRDNAWDEMMIANVSVVSAVDSWYRIDSMKNNNDIVTSKKNILNRQLNTEKTVSVNDTGNHIDCILSTTPPYICNQSCLQVK